MVKNYFCSLCNNSEETLFGIRNGVLYCRKCISFDGNKANKRFIPLQNIKVELPFSLSKEQKIISKKILEAYKNKQNVLLCAVCGSGKTEIVFDSIALALSQGKQVGFVIPRKDVVIDLFPRIKNAFTKNKVVAVYGGHNEDIEGDIIILTSHQLYRYNKYFDYLIMDESDAFPFYGNDVLYSMFERARKGSYVMMSATPLKDMVKKIQKENGIILYLNKRYHGHPLPVPKFKISIFGKKIILLYYLYRYLKNKLPVLVFTPTIQSCEQIFRFCSLFYKDGEFVHSQKENRVNIIDKFRKKQLRYLVTTSILERGITIKNLQVIIFDASHILFDKKALVQISGRVGRKIDAYDGEVIFISDYISRSMQEAKVVIEYANSS